MCGIGNVTSAGTTPGQDLNLSLDRVTSNRNFTNKIWNAAKFILMNLEGVSDAEWSDLAVASFDTQQSFQDLQLAERWILSSLHQVDFAENRYDIPWLKLQRPYMHNVSLRSSGLLL